MIRIINFAEPTFAAWPRCALLAVVLAAMHALGSGCAKPFHLVHDGCAHPAEFRNGRCRPAGVVPDIRNHVIAVDGQGVPHDPTSPGGRALEICEFRSQIAGIFDAMRRFHAGRSDGNKVLIFVHGGLNAPASSLGQADDEIERVMDAGYYPIFLNWNSDLLDTYGEHVTRITQGQSDDVLVRRLLSPLYVLADAGRAVTRAPVVWSNQIRTDLAAAEADVHALPDKDAMTAADSGESYLAAQRWAHTHHGKAAGEVFAILRERQRVDEAKVRNTGRRREEIHLYIGPDLDVDPGHLFGLGVKYVVTSPTKFGLSWLIDGLGSPAWQNMSRRTLMAFDGQLGGNPGNPNADDQARAMPREQRAERATDFRTTGALEVFRQEFLRAVPNRERRATGPATGPATHPATTAAARRRYEITLVGHSMGTMVLNEWLRRDLLEARDQFYAHIVYMAAACSVRDFGRSVVPYLVQHGPDADGDGGDATEFYNLTLHPLADLRERERGADIPPRGSLLVWLDDFLTDPQTPLDRTLGRWDNIVADAGVIPQAVRGQVTIKAFALAPYDDATPPRGQPDYGPQNHGDFRRKPYWCPAFWSAETPIIPGPDCAEAHQ